jgi:hypothetical protein
MHFDQHVQAQAHRQVAEPGELRIVERRDDQEHRIGAERAGLVPELAAAPASSPRMVLERKRLKELAALRERVRLCGTNGTGR